MNKTSKDPRKIKKNQVKKTLNKVGSFLTLLRNINGILKFCAERYL